MVHQKLKLEAFFQYKINMKLLKNTVGSGYNLSDDRSHKVQYIADPKKLITRVHPKVQPTSAGINFETHIKEDSQHHDG